MIDTKMYLRLPSESEMALLHASTRHIHCKIVYYGPGMAGKTTHLQYLHWHLPHPDKSDLLATATEAERTLFFHFRSVAFGNVPGYTLRFHLYTVPGCILYEHTRLKVLEGVDGVVFVADSQQHKLEENIRRLQEVRVTLTTQHKMLPQFPFVFAYNKRDLPGVLPIMRLDHYLNPHHLPCFETIADEGVGVVETLHTLATLVVSRL